MTEQLSYPKEKIHILLLEGIHSSAADNFRMADYSRLEEHKSAFGEEQLMRSISSAHVLGIRSKTRVPARVLAAAPYLLAIGRQTRIDNARIRL